MKSFLNVLLRALVGFIDSMLQHGAKQLPANFNDSGATSDAYHCASELTPPNESSKRFDKSESDEVHNMVLRNFLRLVREDLFRYEGKLGIGAFLLVWRHESGFRFTVLMRLTRYLHSNPLTRYGFYHVSFYLYNRTGVRHGLHIDYVTDIGGGLYIPHALNIVVNSACRIGRNCSLSQGVTLGSANRGARAGTPTIGDSVYIAPGAVVFGSISIGDNAAIGANCVVTKDVPFNGVVVGVPGKIISLDGSRGYVCNTLDKF